MKKNNQSQNSVWKKKIPLNLFLIVIGILAAAIFFANKMLKASHPSEVNNSVPLPSPSASDISEVNMTKGKGAFTNRELFALMKNESPTFSKVKSEIENYIEKEKQKKSFKKISVYLLEQNSGEWMGINHEEDFNSTGYIRLAILITYLKEAESNPTVLEKNLWYEPGKLYKPEEVGSFVLVPGKNYPVKELLKYMMATEDSNSKWLLANNLKAESFEKIFSDLGLSKPDLKHRKFSINVQQYSRFLQVLYNGSYLTPSGSEFALQLLANSPDKNGMLRELPPNVKALHRLGKRCIAADCDFREAGIIYAENEPYILTVFAKGSNTEQLENMTSEISKLAYDNISGNR